MTEIQLRRGTAAAWTAADPTLAQGEPGYETDTGQIKYGDGTTAWSGLPYAGAGGPTPTLAEVLFAGNDADGTDILNMGSGTTANGLTLEGPLTLNNQSIDMGGGSIANAVGIDNVGGGITTLSITLDGDDGGIAMGGDKVTGMGDPEDAQDGATKAYVDAHSPDPDAAAAGQVVASDGAVAAYVLAVQTSAGVPTGAPASSAGFAYDTTAVTGGFYYWNDVAWVKVATIL